MLHNDPFQLTPGYSAHPEQFRDGDALQPAEGLLLHAIVRGIKPIVAVETGTHKGVSSSYIALALRENGFGHLDTMDPKDWGASENLKPFSDWVTYHNMRGIDFVPQHKIDFLFIDGFHEKEEVLNEWHHYLPHLAKDAVVMFHDCHDTEPGTIHSADVNGAVKELGIKTVLIPTMNRMRIYFHGYDSTAQT